MKLANYPSPSVPSLKNIGAILIHSSQMTRVSRAVYCAIALSATITLAQAQNTTNNYTGTTTGSVLTPGNWSLGTVPVVSNDAVFPLGALTGIRTFNGGNLTVGSLDVLATSGTFSIRNEVASATNSILTLGGAGNLGNGVSGTSADLVFVQTGATLNVRADNANGAGTIQVALGQSGNINNLGAANIAAGISGAFDLTKNGAGALNLSGNNSFNNLVINAGLVTIGGVSTANGALGAVGTTGTLGTGTVTINTSAANTGLTFNRSDNYTVNNIISGSGARVGTIGTGILELTGANNFSGAMSIGTGSTLRGSDTTNYANNATVKSVFGTNVLSNNSTSGSANLQLRFNATSDASVETLNLANTGITLSGAGVNFTIDVDRQSGTGTNKIITAPVITAAVATNSTTTINVTSTSNYTFRTTGTTALTVGGATTSGTLLLNPTTANLIIGGNVTNSTASATTLKTIELAGTSTGNSITGSISNGGGGNVTALTKSNTSTWLLSGNSAYTGITTISGGTLALNGTLSASASVAVNNGTLAGTGGTITNNVVVGDSTGSAGTAVIAAGTDGTIGILRTGGLSLANSDAAFKFDLQTSGSLQNDQLQITGALSLGAGLAQFTGNDLLSAGLSNGTVIVLATTTAGITGTFSGLASGASYTLGSNNYNIYYGDFAGQTNNLVLVSAVPEPSTWALIIGALGMLAFWKRPSRQRS